MRGVVFVLVWLSYLQTQSPSLHIAPSLPPPNTSPPAPLLPLGPVSRVTSRACSRLPRSPCPRLFQHANPAAAVDPSTAMVNWQSPAEIAKDGRTCPMQVAVHEPYPSDAVDPCVYRGLRQAYALPARALPVSRAYCTLFAARPAYTESWFSQRLRVLTAGSSSHPSSSTGTLSAARKSSAGRW